MDIVDTAAVDDTTVTDVMELNDGANEINELSDSLIEASAATDEITEIQDVATKSIESGEGLPEAAVEMMMVSLKSINRRLGIKGDKTVFAVPATENFSTDKSRLAATKAVLEEAKKGKESILQTLKRWWDAFWKMISDFFAKLLNRDKKNVEEAKAATKAAEKNNTATDDNSKVIEEEYIAAGEKIIDDARTAEEIVDKILILAKSAAEKTEKAKGIKEKYEAWEAEMQKVRDAEKEIEEIVAANAKQQKEFDRQTPYRDIYTPIWKTPEERQPLSEMKTFSLSDKMGVSLVKTADHVKRVNEKLKKSSSSIMELLKTSAFNTAEDGKLSGYSGKINALASAVNAAISNSARRSTMGVTSLLHNV